MFFLLHLGPTILGIEYYSCGVCSFRKVAGEGKDLGHVDDKSTLVASVPLRRWEDWERSRLRRIKREERRQRDLERLERTFAAREDGTLAPSSRYDSEYEGSDTFSMMSSVEDDQWGPQIGVYNENNPSFPPPPIVFSANTNEGEIFNENDMEAMLDQGFEERPPTNGPYNNYNALSSTSSLTPSNVPRSLAGPAMPRYELNDGPSLPNAARVFGSTPTTAYHPVKSSPPPFSSSSSAVQRERGNGHTKQRSGGSAKGWGPGGPLMDPTLDEKSWLS